MILTKRRQQQSLRNLMAGHPLELSPDLFDDDYYYIWQEIDHALQRGDDFEDVRQLLLRLKNREDDLNDLIEGVLAQDEKTSFSWKTLEQKGREAIPVTWLWASWVPRGFLTLLAAEQGTGKTNLALNLVHRITSGLLAPDSTPLNTVSQNIIYVDAEGFISGLYERAKNWGVDMSRVYMFEWPEEEMLNLGSRDIKEDLWDMCYDLKPDLVVIDSFSDVQIKGEDKVEDIRGVFVFLSRLCTTFDLGLVILHHLRKPQGVSSYSRVTPHDIRGSGHITVKSRSVIGLWKDEEHQNLKNPPVHVECIKANFCQKPPPLYLHYYHPDPNNLDKFELLFEPIPDPETKLPDSLAGAAAEWLLNILADGPTSYADLVKAADKAGFKENVLQNARKALDWKIIDTVGPRRRGNKWALHDQVNTTEDPLVENILNSEDSDMVTWPMSDTPPPPETDPPPSDMAHVTMSLMSTTQKSVLNQPDKWHHPLFFRDHPAFFRNGRGPLPGDHYRRQPKRSGRR